jgi:hypothetical protein
MLARVLTRAIDAQERWAKQLGDRVHGVVDAILGARRASSHDPEI